jgi:hypothetical protein
MDNEGSSKTPLPEPVLDLPGLTRRVERLETENRRLRQVAPALLTLGLLPFLASGDEPKRVPERIEAHEFSLVDRSGKRALQIGFEPRGGKPHIWFYEGNQCVATLSGESLSFDKGAGNRAFFGIDTNGLSGLRLRDKEGKYGVSLGTDKTGMPYISLLDKDLVRLQLSLDPRRRSAPSVTLFGPKGQSGILMTTEGEGDEPVTRYRNSAGSDVMTLGVSRDGSTGLTIYDDKARPRLNVRVSKDGDPSIQVLDVSGTVVSKLP